MIHFNKYQIKHNPWSFKHRYVVTDEEENLVAEASTSVFSFNYRTIIYDASGHELMRVRKKMWAMSHIFFLEEAGEPKFRIRKTWAFRPKIFVDAIDEIDAFMIQGDLWGQEFAFYRDGEEFAYVSKKLWSFKDTYGLAIRSDIDPMTTIAVVIVINLIKKANQRSAAS